MNTPPLPPGVKLDYNYARIPDPTVSTWLISFADRAPIGVDDEYAVACIMAERWRAVQMDPATNGNAQADARKNADAWRNWRTT